jgi:hypothetical protein
MVKTGGMDEGKEREGRAVTLISLGHGEASREEWMREREEEE